MLTIKTVIEPTREADTFDRKVNRLIADGWRLRKRGITGNVVYAELETGREFRAPEEYDEVKAARLLGQ